MMNRLCFEALDRTLRDIMRAKNEDNAKKSFGRKVVVLGGDFRQIPPVVRKGSRYDIVKSSIVMESLLSSKACTKYEIKHCKIK